MGSVIGMLFCNIVFYFVIVASASTLHVSGKTNIQSAAEAALALRPVAGDAATILFAIGIIGSGLLAVPVLTCSAAYALAEALGWKSGLSYTKPKEAKHFYAAIVASTMIGILIDFTGINPIKALFWTAVLNGFVAPPLLAMVMVVSNNPKVMGDRVNGRFTNMVGWITAGIMFAAIIGVFLSWE